MNKINIKYIIATHISKEIVEKLTQTDIKEQKNKARIKKLNYPKFNIYKR